MTKHLAIYLEIGDKRTFAGARDWPGWARNGRTVDAAIDTLIAYGPRFRKIAMTVDPRFATPADRDQVDVVERLTGNASTDFGTPGIAPAHDAKPLQGAELERQRSLLVASWSAFDEAARAARGVTLKTGPRGGGRSLEKMLAHLLEADVAYVYKLGSSFKGAASGDVDGGLTRVRAEMLEALAVRAAGEVPAAAAARKIWTPRYFIRRAAWHALDHAWELEDRSRD